MSEGRMSVLIEVAKRNAPFTAADIYAEVGLERQLVAYHLKRFVEDGLVEKNNSAYSIVNKDRLIESIAFGRRDQKQKRMRSTPIYPDADLLNECIEQYLIMKVLRLPCASEFKEQLNVAIKKTIEGLQDAKRGLNSSQISERKALDKLRESDVERYITLMQEFGVPVNDKVFRTQFEFAQNR